MQQIRQLTYPNKSHPTYNQEKFEKIISEFGWSIVKVTPNLNLNYFCNSQFDLTCNKCGYYRIINQVAQFNRTPECTYCTKRYVDERKIENQTKEFLEKYRKDKIEEYNKLLDGKFLIDEESFDLKNNRVKMFCVNCKAITKIQNKPASIKRRSNCRCYNDLSQNLNNEAGNNPKNNVKVNPIWFAARVQENGYTLQDKTFDALVNRYSFKCPNGHIFKASGAKILTYIRDNRRGCKFCPSVRKLTIEEINKNLKKFNLQFDNSEYRDSKTPHQFKCTICDSKIIKEYGHINGRDCKNCHAEETKYETICFRSLEQLLPSYKIETQFCIRKSFTSKIKSQKKLLVDFKISNGDQFFFVEYNGEQHYQPAIFQKQTQEIAEAKFEHQQVRDQFLRDYCQTNSIKLFEIDGRKIYTKKKMVQFIESEIVPFVTSKL